MILLWAEILRNLKANHVRCMIPHLGIVSQLSRRGAEDLRHSDCSSSSTFSSVSMYLRSTRIDLLFILNPQVDELLQNLKY